MDKGWIQLPLFVIFLLFLSNAHGFKGGAHSNAHHRWGQPSDKTFSPRAVQSSVSEVPVTGILPEEVGSSLFTNRPLKKLNLLQFVKGRVSSMHESTSGAQTAPSGSDLASLPLPLNERYAGSLTSLQVSSGSAATDTASVSTQGESTSFPALLGTSGLSTSDQSAHSWYMSRSLDTSGAKSAEANLPVFSQESISYSSSSAPGATSQGSPVLASEGSGQSISPQGESSSSGLSQGASSQYTPDSYNVLSSLSVSSQSTSDPSTPGLYSSSFLGSLGSLLEASGSFQGVEVAGLNSLVNLSPQSQDNSSQLLPSPLEVSSQSTNGQGTPSLFMVGSESSSDSQSTGPASPLDTQGSLSQSISSPSTSVQSSPSVSTSTQSRSGTQLTSSNFFPVQGGSSSTSSLYLKPQGTLGLYAPASSTKYVNSPMSSHPAVYSQSKSSSGAWFGGSTGFASQGMSSTYSGSVQPQGTTSQYASGSPSYYPSESLSSPQGAASQSATVQSSQKQFTSTFTGNSGTQEGSSIPFNLQGSTTFGGSFQPQDATGSSSSYPSVSLSSPQSASSQSATVQSSRKQFTSSYGTQSGSSKPFTLQGSTTYGGSLQPQHTTSQFASRSPSYYPSVSLSSPQGAASQSATVQSSRKQFTSTFPGNSGTQEGSSAFFNFQGSTTYGGSLQPQDATGSPAYPSVSLSSPQGAASQSATVQSSRKQFTSTFPGNSGTREGSSALFNFQGSTTYGGSLQPQDATGSPAYPSVSLSSPQGAASQSATVQSSRKQFTSTFPGNSGTPEGSSAPFNFQGSTTYGGSLQPQDATGSSSSYPSVSLLSPQYPATVTPATVQSSQKQFTSTSTGNSGTQSGSFKPFTLQGSTTYGGSLQPQGTTSQFASGSPSSYSCHCVSLSSPQGVADQSSQAFQSYSVSQSQKSQKWQPSQGIQTSGAAASQGSARSQSSPMQSLFPSLSSAGGSSSGDPGLFVSAQGGSSRYGGFSLHSQRPSSMYTPGSHAYAKLGSSPLAVSIQSTSDKRSNGLYSSNSLRTQGLIGIVERPSRLIFSS